MHQKIKSLIDAGNDFNADNKLTIFISHNLIENLIIYLIQFVLFFVHFHYYFSDKEIQTKPCN